MSKKNIVWLPHHLEWIKANQFGKPRKELLELLKATFDDLDPRLKQFHLEGLCRKHRWFNGFTGRIESGATPWNKGTKGVCKATPTSFKKGNLPPSHRPVGSERVVKDGWVEIKVAEPNHWQLKHVWLYEQHHGKVPDNHVVRFADGNTLNVTIENLVCVSRAVHGYINRKKLISSNHAELNKAILLTNQLNHLVKKRSA